MSRGEGGVKWVLPRIVISVLHENGFGRTISVRLGMSKHHFKVGGESLSRVM